MTRQANAQTVGQLIELLKKENLTDQWFGWDDGSLFIVKEENPTCEELRINNEPENTELMYLMGYPFLIDDNSCITSAQILSEKVTNSYRDGLEVNFIVIHSEVFKELSVNLFSYLVNGKVEESICKTAQFLKDKYGLNDSHRSQYHKGIICGLKVVNNAQAK